MKLFLIIFVITLMGCKAQQSVNKQVRPERTIEDHTEYILDHFNKD